MAITRWPMRLLWMAVSILIAMPISIWTGAPWYAAFSIYAIVSMVVGLYIEAIWRGEL